MAAEAVFTGEGLSCRARSSEEAAVVRAGRVGVGTGARGGAGGGRGPHTWALGGCPAPCVLQGTVVTFSGQFNVPAGT